MWRMLQADEPDTFVLATGQEATVRDFVKIAFKAVDIELDFIGSELDESAVDVATGNTVLKINPKFYRPSEVESLIGNPDKAKQVLGWEPKTDLEQLCKIMVDVDMLRVERDGIAF